MDDVLYNKIGPGYNFSRQADPYITETLYRLLAAQTNSLYLDIGCGTGNYTIALAAKGLNFYGVEPAEEMLNVARDKNKQVNWLLGQAEKIPADDEVFDGVIATLTIHHWANIKSALTEIYRVLKPGGTVVIFTATPQQMQGYWLNHYFPAMLASSIAQMPSFHSMEQAAEEVSFTIAATEKYFIQDDLKDCFLYAGKNKPELYFNEEVRKGISSFAALANAAEVGQGLARLHQDISADAFSAIKATYDNHAGDYLFIVLKKC
ncbi:class I SAM-dependent methyltransferase [Mucilaginibacter sp. SP1R1]|uniref:class I SAM-dependent methyltransferase n=1 Tax=Mucilaginibacter sp. SP1R1 TaxID=2723091 RepID=UPI00160E0DBF|nr:class I SAM-dependent methyltransferase [Mucilaginibacter sp. SP1R1]MBB6151162.1 ubiquinone/menaquinone biosynthesis C-methylase UbiE [Mucilaginibacter sp. SP1R1]